MSNADFYQHQARARGVESMEDVYRIARDHAYLYDQIAARWLPEDRTRSIVEVACGHGSFLAWLKQRGHSDVRGVDLSREQIGFAEQVGYPVDCADAVEWMAARPEASVQCIVALDLIEHLPREVFLPFLRGCHRLLVPGGALILRHPNADSPLVGLNLYNDVTHVWAYTSNCLRTVGGMIGFSGMDVVDQSTAALRDRRWIKVPLARVAQKILSGLVFAASRDRVRSWSSTAWTCYRR